MKGIIAEIPYALLASGIVGLGLWLANIAFDRHVPHYLSRKIGHAAGGIGFLMCALLFTTAWWPIILSALFGTALLAARFLKPDTFRGVGGTGRDRASYSEVWFAWVAVPVFGVGWLWLDRPLAALSALLFMAWGDCVSGVVRSQVYGRPVKGLWGSLAMGAACLVVSWAFIRPFWIGLVASAVAVGAEWAFGDVGVFKWGDDNWAIPVFSAGAILGLMALTGEL